MIHDNVFIGKNAFVGDRCKIQQYAYIPDGVIICSDVFVGPHTVFCNDLHPPSNGQWKKEPQTIVRPFASIGANVTLLPGLNIGKHSVVGAGAVVTKDVLNYSMVVGNPAHHIGWVCVCGQRLESGGKPGELCNDCR